METQQHTPNLRNLAGEDWRIQCSADDVEAQIVRPDPDRRGFWIGPLARMPMGSTEIIPTEFDWDEEHETTLLDDQQGRNLFAVAALPQFARLVCWTICELDTLEGIHFDSAQEAGRFHRELRNRCKWLAELIDDRGRTMDDTEPRTCHTLMTFDRCFPEQKERIR